MHLDVQKAPENLAALKANTYPGRIVLAGTDETGKYLVLGCVIMGRSPGSRNRVYEIAPGRGRIRTAVADPTQPSGDPALTIYTAMDESDNYFVASNGHQTDAILKGFVEKEPLCNVLDRWEYEPKNADYTPRISAAVALGPQASLCMSILRKEQDSMVCERASKIIRLSDIPQGIALCLQTYEGDGKPLPSYRGDPYRLPLCGGMEDVADQLWSALNPDNRVGLALKFVEINTGRSSITLRNKHQGD